MQNNLKEMLAFTLFLQLSTAIAIAQQNISRGLQLYNGGHTTIIIMAYGIRRDDSEKKCRPHLKCTNDTLEMSTLD